MGVHGDRVDGLDGHPSEVQAEPDCLAREAGPVFHPPKPFLLGGGDDLAVDHEGRRRIGMEGIESQDDQPWLLRPRKVRNSACAMKTSASARCAPYRNPLQPSSTTPWPKSA